MTDEGGMVRAVIAAPFPAVVTLHQLVTEYADQIEVVAVVHEASEVAAQTATERPAALVLSEQLGVDLAALIDELPQTGLSLRVILLADPSPVLDEAGRVRHALADVVLEGEVSATALRDAITGRAGDAGEGAVEDGWPSHWLTGDIGAAPEISAVQQEMVIATEPALAALRGRVVVALSGKGGVGTSVLVTNLAIVLAQRGAAVAVLDLDLQYGDVGVLLRVEAHPGSIASLVDTTAAPLLEDVMATGPEGVRALLAPTRAAAGERISFALVASVLDELMRGHEYVIVDTAPQLDDRLREVLARADRILVVSSFSITAVKDAKIALALLDDLGIDRQRIGVVLNQTRPKTTLGRTDIEASLRFPTLVHLPFEAALDASVDSGVPLVLREPRSEFARQIGAIADQLGETSAADAGAIGARRRFGLRR